jgi:hypothetical protein
MPLPAAQETHRSQFRPALEVAGSGLGERLSKICTCEKQVDRLRRSIGEAQTTYWPVRALDAGRRSGLSAKQSGIAGLQDQI